MKNSSELVYIKAVEQMHSAALYYSAKFHPGSIYEITRDFWKEPKITWHELGESKKEETISVPGGKGLVSFTFEKEDGFKLLRYQTFCEYEINIHKPINYELITSVGLKEKAKENFSITDQLSLDEYIKKFPFMGYELLRDKYGSLSGKNKGFEGAFRDVVKGEDSLSELICTLPFGSLIRGTSTFESPTRIFRKGYYLLTPFDANIYQVIRFAVR